MKNFKICFITAVVLLLSSCKKESSNALDDAQNISAATDSLNSGVANAVSAENGDLETFPLPAELQGCSCYFAKNKEDFDKGYFIYADDYGNTAYIKVNGNLTKIPMEEGDFDPENASKTLTSGNLTLEMKVRKIKEEGEKKIYEGEILILKKDGTTVTSSVYGRCGC